MNKAYPERINFEDEPSVATPLSASNLNKIDYATYEMDNRIIALDTGKANQSDLLLDIKSVAYNPTTGVWTFTHQNGTTDTFDQNIEKIPVTFSMDENGVITMTTADGTTYTCDVGTLIKTYTFVNSGNIQFTVTTDAQGNKSVTANIIDGSVTRAKLDPDYLAQIDLDVASASASASAASGSATAASGSATTASNKALDSEAYAIGTRGGVPVTSEDPAYHNNSKYYAEQAEQTDIGQVNKEIADIVNVYGAKNFVPYPYQEIKNSNGITWTDLGDGRISVNGTATSNSWVRFVGSTSNPVELPTSIKQLLGKEVILSSGENVSGIGIRIDFYDASKTNLLSADTSSVSERRFTVPQNSVYMAFQAFVYSGGTPSNLIIYPMIRLASISDDTYVPYVPTNAKLDEEKISWNDASESVQKNLIPYPYYMTSGGIIRGITWTYDSDGILTANGTVSTTDSDAYAQLIVNSNDFAPGNYIISGCPSDGGATKYWISVYINDVEKAKDYGNGATFTIQDGDSVTVQARVYRNTTVSNLTFKPMIRKATIKDDTYAPYILNNNQLVGWSQAEKSVKKNLNSYPYYMTTRTINGLTITDLGDGRVKVNGTATANTQYFLHSRGNVPEYSPLILPNGKYILSGCPNGGDVTTYRLGVGRTHNNAWQTLGENFGGDITVILNGDDFSANNVTLGMLIQIQSGQTLSDLIFSPMLRYANVKDDTFVPYIPDNTELVSWKANGVLGAKNLISYPYKDTTKTVDGITFTDNGDGSVTVSTVNTGATATKTFDISTRFQGETNDIIVKNGTYILSGCPIGGSSSTYRMSAAITKNGVSTNIGQDVGAGVTLKANGDDYSATTTNIGFGITISNGTIITTPITFKPMLRLAEDTDDTYQPYAMTNYELTQKIAELQAQINALV